MSAGIGPAPAEGAAQGSRSTAAVSLLLRNLVMTFALVMSLLILGRVLLSWIDTSRRSELSVFLHRATEPVLAPIRNLLPPMGMLDLAPMIALIVLSAILQALR